MTASHPWLDRAFADLGTAATLDAASDPRIHGYFADAGHPEVTSDATAWCAAFVGASLERSGVFCTRSLLARSYEQYGIALGVVVPGAVAVFARGTDPSLGHVGFAVGETANEILVLGGNQAHAVSVAAVPRASLVALRWPPTTGLITAPAPLPPEPPRDQRAATDPPPSVAVQSAPTQPMSPTPADDPTFDRALVHVLRMEGGYSNDPYDPGGPTNLGITITDLTAYQQIEPVTVDTANLKAQIHALTPASVAPIYRQLYWGPCQATALPAPLALFHFDTAVNHGLASSARMLQQTLSVAVDGAIGPDTLAAAATADPADAICAYAGIRRDRYRALPTFWRFGRGWLARVDATETAALSLIPKTPPANSVPLSKDPTMTMPAYPSSTQPTVPATLPVPPAPTPVATPASPAATASKWWGSSLTLWGSFITTLATVAPIVGPLLGIDITADMVHQLGTGVAQAIQAVGGVVGILMTIYGRVRVTQSLMRRNFMMRL